MKWKKLGQIFDPREWDLGSDIVGYAQGPQTLVFGEFVRVYFSARRKCGNGKYISSIRFADFDKNFRNVIRVKNNDVVSPSALGAFDEHGIFPMNVLRLKDAIYGYTCGWSRRTSVDIDMAIGFAQSDDRGETFRRLGQGPILASSIHEPFLIGDPYVAVYEGGFHMWYIFGVAWKLYPPSPTPERVYKIGHATSVNGIDWVKEEGRAVIVDSIGDDECQALPTVIKIDALYHMFFCYRYASDFRTNSARAYRIGHASSSDLSNWTRDDETLCIEPSGSGWDSEMVCYPHAFHIDGCIHLLYNGNEFGKHGFGLATLEH